MYVNHVLKNKDERCTSPFGNRSVTLNGRTISGHSGMDFVPVGYIVTPAAGTVTKIKNSVKGVDTSGLNDYGNYIYIKVNEVYTLFFAHLRLNSLTVKVGDKVKAGQVIAYMGTTGYSTGVHLHFGIQKNGTWIDPAPFLSGTMSLTPASTASVKPSTSTFHVGDKVTFKAGALWYGTHTYVPSYCINTVYRIDELNGTRAVLDAKGLNSAVDTGYLIDATVRVGSMVKICAGAVYYGTAIKVPDFVLQKSYVVSELRGKRAVLDAKGLNSAVDVDYLEVV